MKVIRSNVENIENEIVLLYTLTKGKKNTVSASKLTDEELAQDYPVSVWLEYEDEDKDGNPVKLLSIMSGDKIISAQSATLQRNFFEIVDIVKGHNFTIRFTDGKSNAGRRYMSCELVGID